MEMIYRYCFLNSFLELNWIILFLYWNDLQILFIPFNFRIKLNFIYCFYIEMIYWYCLLNSILKFHVINEQLLTHPLMLWIVSLVFYFFYRKQTYNNGLPKNEFLQNVITIKLRSHVKYNKINSSRLVPRDKTYFLFQALIVEKL